MPDHKRLHEMLYKSILFALYEMERGEHEAAKEFLYTMKGHAEKILSGEELWPELDLEIGDADRHTSVRTGSR